MKLKKISNLKAELIKTRIFNSNHKENLRLEETENRLKKALQIIHEYHLNNKKILFIIEENQVNSRISKLLKNTKHILISDSMWIDGLLTNQKNITDSLAKRQDEKKMLGNISETFFQLKKKVDLTVHFCEDSDSRILKESFNRKIITIGLGETLTSTNSRVSYKVPGNFKINKKSVRNFLFYSLLCIVAKKSIW